MKTGKGSLSEVPSLSKLGDVLDSKGAGLSSSLATGIKLIPPQEVIEAGWSRLAPEDHTGGLSEVFPVYLGQCSAPSQYAKLLNE